MTFYPFRRVFTVGTLVLSFFLGCADKAPSGPRGSDSKTNWMKACDRDAQCGSELSCLCGVCSIACDDDAQCSFLGKEAMCLSSGPCSTTKQYCGPSPNEGSGGSSSGTGASGSTGGKVNTGGLSSSSGGTGASPSTSGGTQGAGASGGDASAGAPGSGGEDATGGAGPGEGECGCIAGAVDWSLDGGLVIYQDQNTLKDCNVFEMVRSPVDTDPISESCSTTLMECQDRVSPSEIQSAFEHPDVSDALVAAPVLYGRDDRPVDGAVLRIEREGAVIEVGSACDTCDIPPGVATLASLLRQLRAEQLSEPECQEFE